VDGTVYVAMNDRRIIAIDAKTGRFLWNNSEGSRMDPQAIVATYPYLSAPGAHLHAINYYREQGWIIPSPIACHAYAVDAKTGKTAWTMKPEQMCGTNAEFGDPAKGIMGTLGNHGFYSAMAHPPVFLDKTMFVPIAGGSGSGGRSFVTAFDMSDPQNPRRLYRTFIIPHANGEPNWAIDLCNAASGNGWYFDYPRYLAGVNFPARDKPPAYLATKCTDVDPEVVKNDWMDLVPGSKTFGKRHTASTASPVWGHYPMDPETGIVYMGWGDIGPYPNSTNKYGPNVPGSGFTAFDVKTGKLVWWFSAIPHDLWDFDCSWGGFLAKTSAGQKMFVKGCKNGIVYALDAATGKPVWIFDPPTVIRNSGTNYGADKSNNPNGKDACCKLTKEDLGRPWFNYPSREPGVNSCFTSCLESDIAYDGKRVYLASFNYMRATTIGNVREFGNQGGGALPNCERCFPGDLQQGANPDSTNTDIYAVDVGTGKEVWRYHLPDIGYRGAITVMGEVVMLYPGDGALHFVDATNGKLLERRFFGLPVNVQPTVGATSDGKMQVFLHVGGGGGFYFTNQGLRAEGSLVALGLPDKLPQEIAREAIKQLPKEQLKEVVKEIPRDVIQETLGPTDISPISYAMIGIGAIFLVVAAVLFTRRKKA
jgi:outer membrane protein assembly factor BamB